MGDCQVSRYHDFSAGHRVMGHENKCKYLHGHNYRIHFHCKGGLDDIGRVLDFGAIKARLCQWLEDNWDHRMMLFKDDPLSRIMLIDAESIKLVPFNPTAENMAKYLVEVVGPKQLEGTGITLHKVVVEETRKCAASYEISG